MLFLLPCFLRASQVLFLIIIIQLLLKICQKVFGFFTSFISCGTFRFSFCFILESVTIVFVSLISSQTDVTFPELFLSFSVFPLSSRTEITFLKLFSSFSVSSISSQTDVTFPELLSSFSVSSLAS